MQNAKCRMQNGPPSNSACSILHSAFRLDCAPMSIKIAPSLLSADFSRLAEELASVDDGADIIHLDVMDGHFVPNLTIGPAIVKACRAHSAKVFDCHLMIEEPQLSIERFLEAGADMT